MARATEVPVTPSVLAWAITESGYDPAHIAHNVDVPLATLNEWCSGESRPNLTHARRLVNMLHRPLAALLLPAPPQARSLSVQFRHPVGEQRQLNPAERRHLRRAGRFQQIFSWLASELGISKPRTPSATLNDDPTSVANTIRKMLNVPVADQKSWGNPSLAFDEWRGALERNGQFVFLFSLGKDSCRGFSLADELAPVLAINTAWNESARIFTLFHETAHLVTRTSSACVERVRTSSRTDPVERWCERFAADLLMPREEIQETLRRFEWQPSGYVTDLGIARRIASLYKVSLRAAVIRLIELNATTWALYDAIPPVSDHKAPGGGGRGRSRAEAREDQLGDRATSLLVSAVRNEVISRSQAVQLLDIPDEKFDHIGRESRRGL